ncbi:MAG: molybdopterin biosynthesis protein [Clostridia bacterium]|nr:molybdopterin biosynthesis protein [Clostridia bacterium]
MDKVKRYLHNKPKELALTRWLESLAAAEYFTLKEEVIKLEDGLGRVTARAIFAKNSSPHYLASAMDGYGVRVKDTFGASETNPITLVLGRDAVMVDTGDPVPADFDGVVMVEDAQRVGEDKIEIIKSAYPWQHVRQIGEDIVASELVLPPYHQITPFDLGGLAAAGINEVMVIKKPKVVIIPTGTELVPVGSQLKAGDIVEYNSLVLGGMVTGWGAEVCRLPIVRDDYQEIKEIISTALAWADMVIINAGSSAGREDFTAAIIEDIGQVLTHGVAIKPGKPTILGIAKDKPVIGTPGYPVSAALVCDLFVKPLIYKWYRRPVPEEPQVKAHLAKVINSPLGSDEYVRVKLGRVNEKLVAAPISKGAGVITSLMEADGILTVPLAREGYVQGAEVDVRLLIEPEEINRRVVVSGSHDISIDILDYWLSKTNGFRFAATNVGSLGGLMSLLKGEAECAGIHLLDPTSGEYNIPDAKKYLGKVPVKLVNLAYRQQGFIVAQGNPKKIKGIADLVVGDNVFVNRQKGSGTRVLLDYLIKEQKLSPMDIRGYEREEFTHLAVSTAVVNQTADVGLGILAAAKVFNLDFVPVAEEQFDLCILASAWEKEPIQALLAILQDDGFKKEISALGGYDLRDCGKIIWEG